MTVISRIILLFVLLLVDFYVFQALKLVTKGCNETLKLIIYYSYWSMTVFAAVIMILHVFIDSSKWNKAFATYSFAVIVLTYLSKIFVVLFLLIDDLIRLVKYISTLFQSRANTTTESGNVGISRLEFLSQMGLMIAAVPFFSTIYGMVRGPFRFEVRKQKLVFSNLPTAFNGLKIVQISDIHSGSFLSTQPMEDMVNLVMKQNADVIFFTGDLVNNRNDEMDEFKTILNKIKAPMGVFSIFGNHDYGDYTSWNSEAEKTANRKNLIQTHKDLGWNLLLNEHIALQKQDDMIAVIGVENWSSVMKHPKHGDMVKATKNLPDVPFKILLSHDPTHWHHEVSEKFKDIDLTLSGHTHGMQYGVEIPGFKWSLVQYVYKEWAGLYNKGKQYIYVNRGVGFIGYPGRVGIMPEITVIELSNA